jgi:hypothetical protein
MLVRHPPLLPDGLLNGVFNSVRDHRHCLSELTFSLITGETGSISTKDVVLVFIVAVNKPGVLLTNPAISHTR